MPAETPPSLDEHTRALLSRVSTATLTTQLAKRGIRNIHIQGVRPLSPQAARFVGAAFTLRHIPMREDVTRPELRDDPEYPQRKAVETTPPGHVLVADCRGDVRAGVLGDILLRRLMVRGVAAVVTDGAVRDSGAIARMGFPVFCAGGGAAPAAMAVHHAIDLQRPIACGGVAVFPGDVLVGDEDGVVVVPAALAPEIARDAVEQEELERFIEGKVAAGGSILGLYPPDEATLEAYRRWRDIGDKRGGGPG